MCIRRKVQRIRQTLHAGSREQQTFRTVLRWAPAASRRSRNSPRLGRVTRFPWWVSSAAMWAKGRGGGKPTFEAMGGGPAVARCGARDGDGMARRGSQVRWGWALAGLLVVATTARAALDTTETEWDGSEPAPGVYFYWY